MFSYKKTIISPAAIIVFFTLTSCAPLPGKNDLEKNANSLKLNVNGNYQDIASCVTDRFDREAFKLSELATPVNGYKPNFQKQTIELSNSSTVGVGYYNWIASFAQVNTDTVSVLIVARKTVHPVLSNNYMIDKVVGYVKSCANN